MDEQKLVSYEELIVSNVIQLEAIINILEKKGIASKDEILEEVKKVKRDLDKQIKDSKLMN